MGVTGRILPPNTDFEHARVWPTYFRLCFLDHDRHTYRHTREISIEHPSVGLASLAQLVLEKWFPLQDERAHSLKLFCMYDKRFEIYKKKIEWKQNHRLNNLPKVKIILHPTSTPPNPYTNTYQIIFIYIHSTYMHYIL